ncbi:NAD(P)/FAD-dependent oxidoreductase [Sneathiella marina]|uniref:NAD(P)/FAD-dependent oxidoreductase n=1 Tax=Sneathiella marina TaxID=2950108 RepID=A0ABY4W6C3_9PROT|nr:NAD(P)/FAD-dependent oxidoreductase [Sneathiella marina]USG60206.1 NAD(P)/FAD-dependent oxidoreductase [Sneathiella marina]
MSYDVENIIIGAGVIGLAIARSLSVRGSDVLILERAAHFGSETSSRNSEVIHAGIYYPKGSLKAQYCVEGKEMLYEYCRRHHLPHHKTGKLIVATHEDEIPILDTIMGKAVANGVMDLEMLGRDQVQAMEPALQSVAALLSPSTGTIDSHQLMLAYVGEIEDHGGSIAYNAAFESAKRYKEGFLVTSGDTDIICHNLINSAGLYAQEVAAAIKDLPAEHIPTRYLTKGSYFTMNAPSPFSRLIYPVPNSASLGIHVTLDQAGQIRFGPDQEWIDHIDYEVDPARADGFYDAIRRYWPALPDNSLIPAYAGIRPKIQSPTDIMKDFQIDDAHIHGLAGLVNLFGMESPGLTSSLKIGDVVADLLDKSNRL